MSHFWKGQHKNVKYLYKYRVYYNDKHGTHEFHKRIAQKC